MTTPNEAQQEALDGLLATWDVYSGYDIGPHLTCGEADALAALFRAAGAPSIADSLIEGHAESDDEGDSHYIRRNA